MLHFREETTIAVQKEILDVYIFYNALLPKVSETLRPQVAYLIRDMTDQFPKSNPYTVRNSQYLY